MAHFVVEGGDVEVSDEQAVAIIGAAVANLGQQMRDAAQTFLVSTAARQEAAFRHSPGEPWRTFLPEEAAVLLDALQGAGLRPKVDLPALRPAVPSKRGRTAEPTGCGGDNWEDMAPPAGPAPSGPTAG
jgi:hypothetical protein